jgi:hypothetical protein
LVIIIGFLGSAGFITLLLTIIIVLLTGLLHYTITFSPPACVFMLFFFGLGWSNRVKLS